MGRVSGAAVLASLEQGEIRVGGRSVGNLNVVLRLTVNSGTTAVTDQAGSICCRMPHRASGCEGRHHAGVGRVLYLGVLVQTSATCFDPAFARFCDFEEGKLWSGELG